MKIFTIKNFCVFALVFFSASLYSQMNITEQDVIGIWTANGGHDVEKGGTCIFCRDKKFYFTKYKFYQLLE